MSVSRGTKETSELLVAMGDLAVACYKAQKAVVQDAPAGEKAQQFAQALAGVIMTNPQIVNDLKLAFDNITEIPSEIKELGFSEILQLVSVAGSVAAKAAAAVKE